MKCALKVKSTVLVSFPVLTIYMLCTSVFQTQKRGITERFDHTSENSPERTKCVLYDRPPRTGSTTIGRALGRCLAKAGYTQQPLPKAKSSKRRATAIELMLESEVKNNRRALVTRHVYVSEKDVKLIESKCDDFLYISSTAPIKERLWSGIKHLLAKRHGNTTRDSWDMAQALELLQAQDFEKGSLRSLDELNAYPYLTEEAENAEIKRKPIPDYVIRKESLQNDLQALLRAFGCKESFSTRNVHEDSIENVDELFSTSYFSDDDQVHKHLNKVADLNNVGTLKLVKAFVPLRHGRQEMK